MNTTLYSAYAARNAMLAPWYGLASAQTQTLRWLERYADPGGTGGAAGWGGWARYMRAIPETFGTLRLTHERPAFGIEETIVGGEPVAVHERLVCATPFGSLLNFAKPGAEGQPKVLAVPGLAGHYATLIRATVRTLLPDHDVYVADWHNARDVPVSAGRFGYDDFVQHLIDFMGEIGPGTCLLAVCQPCPAVLAAASLMAEEDHPAQPSSLVLMSGPVDTRVNAGPVNRFAERQAVADLERRVVTRVPLPYRGAGRRVYPGFVQIAGFMGMDPGRHLKAFAGLMHDIAQGRDKAARRTERFYEEYFAVLDIAAEFYLETVQKVFVEHQLPRGTMEVAGRPVRPEAITSALMTIEGDGDDICPPGQTEAAHALCTGIPAERRRHHLQPGVGHYGVFSGSRFELEIYPRIRSFIAEFAGAGEAVAGAVA